MHYSYMLMMRLIITLMANEMFLEYYLNSFIITICNLVYFWSLHVLFLVTLNLFKTLQSFHCQDCEVEHVILAQHPYRHNHYILNNKKLIFCVYFLLQD